jgi:hypothetical protein
MGSKVLDNGKDRPPWTGSESYLFVVSVVEMKFCEVVVIIGSDIDQLSVFPAPPQTFGEQSFCKICMDDGVYIHFQAFVLLHGEIAQVLFNFIFEDE